MALYLLRPSEMATSWLFTGLPRSGKTYHAVKIINQWVRHREGVVLTNVIINTQFLPRRARGRVHYLPTAKDVIEKLKELRPVVDGHILLVLDEVASVFDSRNFKNFPPDLRAFLTQHAKMRISIITICHRHDLIDVSFRKLSGYVVEHIAANRAAGCLGLIAGVFIPGLMVRYTQALDGSGDPTGKPYEKKLYFVREKITRLYDTFQIVEGGFAGSKALAKAVVQGTGWKRKLIMLAVVYGVMRFTGCNRPMSAPEVVEAVKEVKPWVRLHGRVMGVNMQTRLCDFETSSGDVFKLKPLSEWGKDPVGWVDRYAAVDIWSTSPVVFNYELRERIRNAAIAEQKK